MSERMSCRELLEFLDDYLAGELETAVRSEFETHLAQCPYCRDYLQTYRDTIRLGGSLCDDPQAQVPDEVPEQLVQAILAAREKG